MIEKKVLEAARCSWVVEYHYENKPDIHYVCSGDEWRISVLKEKLYFEHKVLEEDINELVQLVTNEGYEMGCLYEAGDDE